MIADKVIQMPSSTYTAKLFVVAHGDKEFKLAGTLDGFIDFATPTGIYPLSTAEAEEMMKALGNAVADVKAHCLYDRDSLLELRRFSVSD